jgi:hypothetical protein
VEIAGQPENAGNSFRKVAVFIGDRTGIYEHVYDLFSDFRGTVSGAALVEFRCRKEDLLFYLFS